MGNDERLDLPAVEQPAPDEKWEGRGRPCLDCGQWTARGEGGRHRDRETCIDNLRGEVAGLKKRLEKALGVEEVVL